SRVENPVCEQGYPGSGSHWQFDHSRPGALVAANRTGIDRDGSCAGLVSNKHRGFRIPRDNDSFRLHIDREEIKRRRDAAMSERIEMIMRGPGDRTIANAFLDQADGL